MRAPLRALSILSLITLTCGSLSAQAAWIPLPLGVWNTHSEVVWGLAPDNSVWKWNAKDSYWFQPNPAATLRQISVGVGEVWGTTSNNHVWKWDPATQSWFEPNPAALLLRVSAGRGKSWQANEVWGIGVNQTVWRWNGNSWYEPNPGTIMYGISVGSHDNIWAIGAGNRLYKWVNRSWIEPDTNARGVQITASIYGHDAWKLGTVGIHTTYPIFRWNGSSWFEPNSVAVATQISARSSMRAWALGVDNRVFETNNGGAGWTEPNPAAGLKQVSVGLSKPWLTWLPTF